MRTDFIFLLLCLSLFSSSCFWDEPGPPAEAEGLKPLYLAEGESAEIRSQSPMPYGTLGKIVAYGDYIYVGEQITGIHVVNNIDPKNPVQEYFWSIPGVVDFTLKDGYLYADNGIDLLTINITDPADIKVISISEEVYDDRLANRFPSDYFGFFECVDSTRGTVIGWETATLINPSCRR